MLKMTKNLETIPVNICASICNMVIGFITLSAYCTTYNMVLASLCAASRFTLYTYTAHASVHRHCYINLKNTCAYIYEKKQQLHTWH